MSLKAISGYKDFLEITPAEVAAAGYDFDAMTVYSALRNNCELDIHSKELDDVDFNAMIRKEMKDWNDPEKTASRVLEKMKAGDLDAKLDYAIYLLTGYKTKKDEQRGEKLLKELAIDLQAPRDLRAKASSHLAQLFDTRIRAKNLHTMKESEGVPMIMSACVSIELGLTSPAVLSIGKNWERHRANFNDSGFQPLWKAVDKRSKEVEKEQAARMKKWTKAPNKYACANPGCPISAAHRGPLMKCSGPCDAEVKPYYCEKKCQRAHWQAHKPFCKPGMDRHSDMPIEESQSWLPDKTLQDVKVGDDADDPTPYKDRPRRQVVVPGPEGQPIVFDSNMSVEELKAFKAAVDEKTQTNRRARRRRH